MALPYKCIQACNIAAGDKNEWILFGATGPYLVAQSSNGASKIWPSSEIADLTDINLEDEADGPPGKRIKLSHAENTANFSSLTLSNDGKHLIAVTDEDKCIRVFRFDSQCQLHLLSQRCMARRPCAIAVTSDDSTILCADKFGDVYALPLIQPPEDGQNGNPTSEDSEALRSTSFMPAASVLTVHSGRNRKVLEEQMKQAGKGQTKIKEPLGFKHDLLLGHVSMLTDIAFTTLGSRSYIFTADRDEHIRISRGPPQAHIIEGFCLGHEAFVSRLCLASPGLLVSGGGDAYLYIWDWLNCRLLEKLCIRDTVVQLLREQQHLASVLLEDEDSFKIAVSGMWRVPSSRSGVYEILVACEGVPALFGFRLEDSSQPVRATLLNGNALDVTFIGPSQGSYTAVVSVDNVHAPGSTTEIREDKGPFRLQYFSYQGDEWIEDANSGRELEWFNCSAPNGNKDSWQVASRSELGRARTGVDEKAIRDILYGVENLRKRPGSDD